ncbi:MAG: hypothetical protein AAB425_02070 [Bdellovibrionota bacterium]
MINAYNLVARSRWGAMPFLDFKTAQWTWQQLPRLFPEALAALLMGNHLHLTLETHNPAAARGRLSALLRALSARLGSGDRWEPVPEAKPIADRMHLQRSIRYTLLNRCRAGLDIDPLYWPWSTLRDGIGAVANPWIPPKKIAHALGWSAQNTALRFHEYVSADERASPAARSVPTPAVPSPFASYGLPDIRAAACAVFRVNEFQKRDLYARPLFFHLARKVGYRNAAELARYTGTARTTVHGAWNQTLNERNLSAGMLCLGDQRLRRPTDAKSDARSSIPSGGRQLRGLRYR